MRAVRTARPDELHVVGEMRAVKRIVKEDARRDTDACMLDSFCPSVDSRVRGCHIPMRQVESLQWEPATDNHKYQHDGRNPRALGATTLPRAVWQEEPPVQRGGLESR